MTDLRLIKIVWTTSDRAPRLSIQRRTGPGALLTLGAGRGRGLPMSGKTAKCRKRGRPATVKRSGAANVPLSREGGGARPAWRGPSPDQASSSTSRTTLTTVSTAPPSNAALPRPKKFMEQCGASRVIKEYARQQQPRINQTVTKILALAPNASPSLLPPRRGCTDAERTAMVSIGKAAKFVRRATLADSRFEVCKKCDVDYGLKNEPIMKHRTTPHEREYHSDRKCSACGLPVNGRDTDQCKKHRRDCPVWRALVSKGFWKAWLRKNGCYGDATFEREFWIGDQITLAETQAHGDAQLRMRLLEKELEDGEIAALLELLPAQVQPSLTAGSNENQHAARPAGTGGAAPQHQWPRLAPHPGPERAAHGSSAGPSNVVPRQQPQAGPSRSIWTHENGPSRASAGPQAAGFAHAHIPGSYGPSGSGTQNQQPPMSAPGGRDQVGQRDRGRSSGSADGAGDRARSTADSLASADVAPPAEDPSHTASQVFADTSDPTSGEPQFPAQQEGPAPTGQAAAAHAPVPETDPRSLSPRPTTAPPVIEPVFSTPIVTTRGGVYKKTTYVPKPRGRKLRVPESSASESEAVPGAFPAPQEPLVAPRGGETDLEHEAGQETSPPLRGDGHVTPPRAPSADPAHPSEPHQPAESPPGWTSFAQSREADEPLLDSPRSFRQSTPVTHTVFATPLVASPRQNTPLPSPKRPQESSLPDPAPQDEEDPESDQTEEPVPPHDDEHVPPPPGDPWSEFNEKIAQAKSAAKEAAQAHSQSTPGRNPYIDKVLGNIASSSLDAYDLFGAAMSHHSQFMRELAGALRDEINGHSEQNTVDVLNEIMTIYNAIVGENSPERLATFEQVTTVISLLSHADTGFLSRLDAVQKTLDKIIEKQDATLTFLSQFEQKTSFVTETMRQDLLKKLDAVSQLSDKKTEIGLGSLEMRLDMTFDEVERAQNVRFSQLLNSLDTSANSRAQTLFDAMVREIKALKHEPINISHSQDPSSNEILNRLSVIEEAISSRNGRECPCLYGGRGKPRESPDDDRRDWHDHPPHMHPGAFDRTLGHEKPEPRSFFIDPLHSTTPPWPPAGAQTTVPMPAATAPAPVPRVHFSAPPVTPFPARYPMFVSTALEPVPEADRPPSVPAGSAPPRVPQPDLGATPAPPYFSFGPPSDPPAPGFPGGVPPPPPPGFPGGAPPPPSGFPGGAPPPPPPPSGPALGAPRADDLPRGSQGLGWSTGSQGPTGQVYPKVRDLPKFSAKKGEDVDVWIAKLTAIYQQMRVPFDHLLANLPMLLSGEARDWITTLAPETRATYLTWDQWSDAMRMEFREANYIAKKGARTLTTFRRVLIDLEPSLNKKPANPPRERFESRRNPSSAPRQRFSNTRESSTSIPPSSTRSTYNDQKARGNAPQATQSAPRRYTPASGSSSKPGQSSTQSQAPRPTKAYAAEPQDEVENAEDATEVRDEDEYSERSSDAYDSDEDANFAESYAVTTRSRARAEAAPTAEEVRPSPDCPPTVADFDASALRDDAKAGRDLSGMHYADKSPAFLPVEFDGYSRGIPQHECPLIRVKGVSGETTITHYVTLTLVVEDKMEVDANTKPWQGNTR
ncbi:hypothetical protein AURDEDRAFT_120840 [Auricularia subglabra TFB-10046 SS5]|nr:hypothetical protein AURDEDRAFT_120840 [Auricularia subglabra TFB-10046 SS5]